MKFAVSLCLLLMLVPGARAGDPTDVRPPPPPEPRRSAFVFSLLPKAFQKHPELDFHVISEMTNEGRKAKPPTPQHPVYYLSHAGKFTQLGHNPPANEHGPDIGELTRSMQKALAASNYVPATPSSPLPSLVVVFTYGSFARFSTEMYDFEQTVAMEQLYQNADPSDSVPAPFISGGDNRDADSLLPIVLSDRGARTDVLQRAELIGGEKFAHGLAAALDQEAVYQRGREGLSVPGIENASPFHRFMNANDDLMELVEQSFNSCYFVVASAYDYVAMKQGRKVLLWRTKMTVDSSGVSMSETLPSLVVAAGPYFGRDMTVPATLNRKITREGHVEVGTPEVVDFSEPAAPPAPNPPAKK